MKSIELSTLTNAINRKNLERWSSCATHLANKYVCLRTDRTRARCFIDTCCQSVPFATCVRGHWLIRSSKCQRPRKFSSSPHCWPRFGRLLPTPTRRRYAPSRSILPTRRKRFAEACRLTNISLSSWWSAADPIGWNQRAAKVCVAMFSSSPGTMTAAMNSSRIDWRQTSSCLLPRWSVSPAVTRAPDCSHNSRRFIFSAATR